MACNIILDLPIELLVQICEVIRNDSSDPQSVKNLRLTHRRLNEASSHLLVGSHVYVGINTPSITRLENISNHPNIRIGVQTVVVNLDFFSHYMANDFVAFLRECVMRELEFLDIVRNEAEGDAEDEIDLQHEEILDAWELLVRRRPVTWTDFEWQSQQILFDTHRQYVQKFDDQHNLLSGTRFIKRFADAVANMRNVKSLKFEVSEAHKGSWPMTEKQHWLNGRNYIQSRLLQPSTWIEAQRHDGIQPIQPIASAKLMVELPIALHGMGIPIKSMNLEVKRLHDFPNLYFTQHRRMMFAQAVRSLQEFKVTCPTVCFSHSSHMEYVQFVSLIANATDMRSFHLDSAVTWYHEPTQFGSGPAFGMVPWSNTVVKLSCAAIHLAELEALVRRVEKLKLCTDRLNLLSGSWADLLDLFRGSNASIEIVNPRGGECGGMEQNKKDQIFNGLQPSPARLYCEGIIPLNPIRYG